MTEYDICQEVQLTEGWVSSSVTPKKKKKGKKKKDKKPKEPMGFYKRKKEES